MPEADPALPEKSVIEVLHGLGRHWVGDGFPVQTLFAYPERGPELSPFLLLDHAGPHAFAPTTQRRGVGAHPHRGFETVTLVFAGEVEHRDSAGGGGTIGPGDVQWMTAGAGIVHEEFHSPRFAASGGNFEVAQLWVNLPAARKRTPARYQAITADRIPERTLAEGRARVRIVAGSFPVGSDIVQGPAETHSPVNVWDVQVVEDGPLALSLPDGQTALLVVLSGSLTLSEGSVAARDSSIRFTREGVRLVVGATHGTHVLVLAGAPLHEPIAGSGPFVMNTPDELAQAYADHRRGRLGH
ncbi:MAG: pirin family protein [Planctomycetes bacterium]|nr:pirin family protein [Planctomycetota bacterium]